MKEIPSKVVLVAVGLIAAVVLGEILVRVFLPAPQTVVAQAVSRAAVPSVAAEDKDRLTLPVHPEQGGLYVSTGTGRRLRPNVRVTIENHALSKRRIEIETNSLGYRNRELGAKQGRRILFLGDSITFGDYLAEQETFVRRVETVARARGREWETVNAGVGAISLENELAVLLETGLGTEPDVVVLCFYPNDFQESPGIRIQKLPPWVRRSRLAYYLAVTLLRRDFESEVDIEKWEADFVQRHRFEWGDYKEKQGAFNGIVLAQFKDWGGSWSPYAWEYMRPLFGEFRRLADAHGFRLVLVCLPVLCQVETEFMDDYAQRQLKHVGADLGVPVLDLLPVLRKAYRESDNTLFYDHCHHTPYASAVIATNIYTFLNTHLP